MSILLTEDILLHRQWTPAILHIKEYNLLVSNKKNNQMTATDAVDTA